MIDVHQYRELDKKKVIEFVNRIRTEIYGGPILNGIDLENILQNYHIFLLAEERGQLVGTLGLLKTDFGGEIKRVYIEREFRRRGLGRRLIEQIFDYARTKGVQRIELFTYEFNIGAVAFFSKAGLKQTKIEDGKVYFNWNADEILKNSTP